MEQYGEANCQNCGTPNQFGPLITSTESVSTYLFTCTNDSKLNLAFASSDGTLHQVILSWASE